MKLTTFTDPRAFLARVQPALEGAEAANNLIIGISNRLVEHPERFRQAPYMASVMDGNSVIAAALMTPPQRVILYSRQDENTGPLQPIASDLIANRWRVPGVVGPSRAARAFAGLWTELTGRGHRPGASERVYELRKVDAPSGVPGRLRAAAPDELPLVVEWLVAFNRDAHLQSEDRAIIAESATLRIATREIWLWDDSGPVSLAGMGRHTTHGMAIGPVYTPPEYRNRGYASACVAALSQQLLDQGWEFCCLFTDLANPTSNSIYQRIGYRPICDVNEYNFEVEA